MPGVSAVPVLNMDSAVINTNTDVTFMGLSGLAALLVSDGLLDMATAKEAYEQANTEKLSLVYYLVRKNILSSQVIVECASRHLALAILSFKDYNESQSLHSLIKPEIIYRYRVMPWRMEQNCLYLGMTDPTDQQAISALRFHTGFNIRPMLMAEEEMEEFISQYRQKNGLCSPLEKALLKMTAVEEPTLELKEKDEEPVIDFVNQLLHNAIDNKASDIHIEPYAKFYRIRFRCDGLLAEIATLPSYLGLRVLTRLKIMANLNIAEKRIPQDGRFDLVLQTKVDVRVNTCPTLFGEKLVLRLLNAMDLRLDIAALGLLASQEKIFLQALNQPQGLILVTGPTGSGKTITLYSALNYLNQISKNISSIEDPIEIELMGINQINVNTQIGLSFAHILRSLLRQDPDIIMIGEIRDQETAVIAMQAAQTGHLVLSTLHTSSAAETIYRLKSMGIADQYFLNSLSLIIAQRLLRKLCAHCKKADSINKFQYHANRMGCQHCYQGYKGRIGIFELLPIESMTLSSVLAKDDLSASTLKQRISLWTAGLEKVNTGTTSLSELLRIAGKRIHDPH